MNNELMQPINNKSTNSETSEIKFLQHNKKEFPIRKEEQKYCEEIFNKYNNNDNTINNTSTPTSTSSMFITEHSDELNLYANLESERTRIISRTNYEQGDYMLELRGGIIKLEKVKLLLEKNVVGENQLRGLGFWNEEKTELISVKNGIAAEIVRNDDKYLKYLKDNEHKSNCQIASHLNSKLFIIATKEIEPEEEIILYYSSLMKFLYV